MLDLVATAITVMALLVLMTISVFPPIYFWRLHGIAPEKLWLPRTLAIAFAMLCPATVYLGIIAIWRTLYGLAGVPSWTAPLTTAAVVLMALAPAYVLFAFLRRS